MVKIISNKKVITYFNLVLFVVFFVIALMGRFNVIDLHLANLITVPLLSVIMFINFYLSFKSIRIISFISLIVAVYLLVDTYHIIF